MLRTSQVTLCSGCIEKLCYTASYNIQTNRASDNSDALFVLISKPLGFYSINSLRRAKMLARSLRSLDIESLFFGAL